MRPTPANRDFVSLTRQPSNSSNRRIMTATVAIIGGGYGGITAAKALDDITDVVLVEPRDTFVHNVAALRALVDPAWTDRMFLPYRSEEHTSELQSRGHL